MREREKGTRAGLKKAAMMRGIENVFGRERAEKRLVTHGAIMRTCLRK